MTRRRWIADEWNESTAMLLGPQAVHLARVLRAQVGQEFDIVVGGKVRRGVIASVRDSAVEFALHEELEIRKSLPLTILLSIVRFERMDWAIEKLTELGVAGIVPLIAQRSEKHLAQAAAKRTERWRRIVREAAQQSRRNDVPEISDPSTFSQWASNNVEDALRILLSEQQNLRPLRDYLETTLDPATATSSLQKIYTAVGPEGGWTEMELAAFANHRWQPVSLGPLILRAETAAIALASVLSVWLEI